MTAATATSGLRGSVGVVQGGLDLRADFEVAAGDVLAVLGPNGAGKTTLLRAIAGLVRLTEGQISVGDRTLAASATGVHELPEDRPVGMVFQDYLLFPHLSVLDNVAFGPRCRGRSRAEAVTIARGWLGRLGIATLAELRPVALSGGQAQRVALARALAHEPSVLLLDEPMAALDATAVGAVRRELRDHLAGFEGATVLVTHDPLDALALASHVLILEAGGVTQAGTIGDITARPRTRYVADLIGVNLLHGRGEGTVVALVGTSSGAAPRLAVADPCHGDVHLLIRPHAVAVHTHQPDGSPRNQWPARVAGLDLMGDRVRVRLDGPVPLVAEVTTAAVADLGLHEGVEVWAAVKATEIEVY